MLNRKDFIEKAKELAGPYAGTRRMFLLDLDFVEFRMVNYCYGIEKGTELLLAMDAYLKNLPGARLTSRAFSDRFFLLLETEKPCSGEEIAALWDRFAARFVEEQKDRYPAYHMKLRCGICPVDHADIVSDMNNAAVSRKAAAGSGSSATMVFTADLQEKIYRHSQAEYETNLALTEHRFTFYLQPKVDLHSGEIVGAEALARGLTKDGGVLSPESFLPVMEEMGTVAELDDLILDQVCAHLAERKRTGRKIVPIAVNFSRLHVQNPDEAKRIDSVVRGYGLETDWISFELTEMMFREDCCAGAKRLMDGLRSYGYKVAIDDYGYGYISSLLWETLDFDTLKLDRRMLASGKLEKKKNDLIAEEQVSFARRMDCSVVCEGTETEEDCKRVLGWGGRYAQGFFFSAPAPQEEFYEMYDRLGGRFDLRPFKAAAGGSEQFRRLSEQLTVAEILLECLQILAKEPDYDTAFNGFLERLGRFYRADRAYIFEFDALKQAAYNTYEWCAPYIAAQKDNLQGVPLTVMSRWIDLFTNQGEVYINSLSREVDRSSEEYRILKQQGITSILAAPLCTDDGIEGFLGVDNPCSHEDDLTLLRASTNFIIEELRKRQLIERLEYASYIDKLTGLRNRNSYIETLQRYEEKLPDSLGIVFADINGMKEANDRHGHEYGDQILKRAASFLKRTGDRRVYRIGGDEFVILFEAVSREEFDRTVERICREYETERPCDMSFGYAWKAGDMDVNALIDEADRCMYMAKREWYAKYRSDIARYR